MNLEQFHNQLNKVYNIDCLKGMKIIPENSVDTIITDPPYGLKEVEK